MAPQPSQVRLVAYPSGIPADDVWSITHDSPPELADGSLKHRQHIVEGIESFPEAFRMLFRGENHGKLLLRP